MSEIAIERIAVTTAGAAGAAAGSTNSIPIQGFLLDVFIDYHASAPATTDVTISEPVFGNLLVMANNNADCRLAPREPLCDGAAAAVGLYDLIPINSALTVTVSQADALSECVVVTLRWLTP